MELNKYINYFVILIIFVAVGHYYHKYKYLINTEEDNHYKIVEEYLINDSSLARSKKQILWIHVEREINARWWENFGSRNSTRLNKPYQFLTIKNMIDKCGKCYNICLIDDDTFGRIIPGWSIDLNKTSDPIKSNLRELAKAKILFNYGGIFMPSSMIVLNDLHHLMGDKPIIGEFLNKSVTNISDMYEVNTRLLGCNKKDETMKEYINFNEILISNDSTDASEFLGNKNKWWKEKIAQDKVVKIDSQMLGITSAEGVKITIEDLINTKPIEFSNSAVAIYIPDDELTNRRKYEWFVRCSPKQVLESDTNIGKILVSTC